MNGADAQTFGAFVAVLAMAGVTYLIRCGGYWVMGRVPLTPRLLRMLDALPGSVVAAVLAPVMLNAGTAGCLGIGAVVVVMMLSRNEFIAVFAGMGVVALVRAVGL